MSGLAHNQEKMLPAIGMYQVNEYRGYPIDDWRICQRNLMKVEFHKNLHYYTYHETSLQLWENHWLHNGKNTMVRETLMKKFVAVFAESGYFVRLYLHYNGSVEFFVSGSRYIPKLHGWLNKKGTITAQSTYEGIHFWDTYLFMLFQAVNNPTDEDWGGFVKRDWSIKNRSMRISRLKTESK